MGCKFSKWLLFDEVRLLLLLLGGLFLMVVQHGVFCF